MSSTHSSCGLDSTASSSRTGLSSDEDGSREECEEGSEGAHGVDSDGDSEVGR